MFQLTQRCDRWSQLVGLAYWQLYLAKTSSLTNPDRGSVLWIC